MYRVQVIYSPQSASPNITLERRFHAADAVGNYVKDVWVHGLPSIKREQIVRTIVDFEGKAD